MEGESVRLWEGEVTCKTVSSPAFSHFGAGALYNTILIAVLNLPFAGLSRKLLLRFHTRAIILKY
jgi:hypothetical protein